MSPPQSWSDLPDLLLLSILHHLTSLPDLFSFSSVCRSWRSFFLSSSPHLLSTLPPLLLTTPPFLLQPLNHHNTSYKSLLPSNILSHSSLSYSHGHLILLHRHRLLTTTHHQIILSNVLTAAEVHTPVLPSGRYPYYYAALTSPPSSPNSILLVFYSKFRFLSYRIGIKEPTWCTHAVGPNISYISHVLPFKNRIFAVTDQADLLEFHVDHENVTVEKLLNAKRISVGFDRYQFGPQLVACGGELLLVIFLKEGERICKIDLYKLDFERMVWLGVEGLGEYSLFVDCGGKCPVALKWGRGNSVYVAGTGCSTWREFPLDGNVGTEFSSNMVLLSFNLSLPRWPSPIWVYPSLFY